MNSIKNSIRYNATIKSNDFVSTKLSGLAHLKTGMIITDTDPDLNNTVFKSFPNFVITNQIITDSIFNEDMLHTILLCTQKNYPIVIGCNDYQWSYIIYMLVVIHIGNISSYEHGVCALKDIIDLDSNLPDITPDTLTKLSWILTNYAIFEKFSEEIVSRNMFLEDMYILVSKEHMRQKLMLSLVFGKSDQNITQDKMVGKIIKQTETQKVEQIDSQTNTKNLTDYETESQIRSPIPVRTEQLIDPDYYFDDSAFYPPNFGSNTSNISSNSTNDYLEPIDPEQMMADTSNVKIGCFPDKNDLLGITSYAGYEPKPDPISDTDMIKSAAVLNLKFNEFKSMIGGKRFNEEYVRNLLHAGMTVDEVYCLLTLSV